MNEERTAIHEAGHAVLAHVLGVGLKRVTIIPDDDSSGATTDGGEFGEDAENLRLYAEEAFWQRMAIMRYAGAEAVRRLAPRSRWKDGAGDDYRWAAIALEKITTDRQSLVALQAYAQRRARLLVENYWPEIERLARVLAERETIEGSEASKEIHASLNSRRHALMSY